MAWKDTPKWRCKSLMACREHSITKHHFKYPRRIWEVIVWTLPARMVSRYTKLHPLSYLAHILNSNIVDANMTRNPSFYIPTVQQLQGVAALTNWTWVPLSCQVHKYLQWPPKPLQCLTLMWCAKHTTNTCGNFTLLWWGQTLGYKPILGSCDLAQWLWRYGHSKSAIPLQQFCTLWYWLGI